MLYHRTLSSAGHVVVPMVLTIFIWDTFPSALPPATSRLMWFAAVVCEAVMSVLFTVEPEEDRQTDMAYTYNQTSKRAFAHTYMVPGVDLT